MVSENDHDDTTIVMMMVTVGMMMMMVARLDGTLEGCLVPHSHSKDEMSCLCWMGVAARARNTLACCLI